MVEFRWLGLSNIHKPVLDILESYVEPELDLEPEPTEPDRNTPFRNNTADGQGDGNQ